MIKVIVERDSEPLNPREDEGNLGMMYCWHSRYKLGDLQPAISPEVFLASISIAPRLSSNKDSSLELATDGRNREETVILPLFLMDHSGISISTSSFKCNWDSGQVGYIAAIPSAIQERFHPSGPISDEFVQAVVKQALIAEVEEYNFFLTGEAWTVRIVSETICDACQTKHTEEEDSFSFLGSDLGGIKAEIPAELHSDLEKAWANRS